MEVPPQEVGKAVISKTIPLKKPRDTKMWVLAQTTTFRPLLWRTNAVDES